MKVLAATAIVLVFLFGCTSQALTEGSLAWMKAEAVKAKATELEQACIDQTVWPKGKPIGTVILNARMEHPFDYCPRWAKATARRLVL